MFDVIVFDAQGQYEWCVNLAAMTEDNARRCLADATAPGAFWEGRDVRLVPVFAPAY